MTLAIETHNLTKRYGNAKQTDAVHDVTLSIPQGELFGLFGANGAGKSTLIRILTTLLAPTSGDARVSGFDVVKQPEAVRATVGMVFSNEHSFYKRLTGRENLNFFAALQNVPHQHVRTRVNELLEMFTLERYADVMFHTYSTGMRQKMNVARALLHNPPILFLDEPTKGMDLQTADTVRALLKQEIVERQGKTVFLTTHDLYEMEHLCDRIGVIAHGEMRAFGRPRDLLLQAQSKHLYQMELAQPLPNLTAQLERVNGIRDIRANGVRIEFEADEKLFSEKNLWDVIYGAGGQVRRFGPHEEGLRALLRDAADDEPLV
jgi:ABC-2 type transport system ATP-binding protein